MKNFLPGLLIPAFFALFLYINTPLEAVPDVVEELEQWCKAVDSMEPLEKDACQDQEQDMIAMSFVGPVPGFKSDRRRFQLCLKPYQVLLSLQSQPPDLISAK